MDSGEGIPNYVREHLFNPFFTTKSGGSGLGLAMTKKIIEGMGGKVKLRSKINKGTILSFYLPPISATSSDFDKKDDAADGDDVPTSSNIGFLSGPMKFFR
jgi:nitrogen-specific signal transduction histidine kinase